MKTTTPMKSADSLCRITTLKELRRRRIENRRQRRLAAAALEQRGNALVGSLSPSNIIGGIADGVVSLFDALSRAGRKIAWFVSLFERRDAGRRNDDFPK